MTSPPDPKALVRAGYDRISANYRSDVFDFEASGYREMLRLLDPHLQPSSRILDLGCGCGVPVARHLARNHQVTGVDISDVQVERAKTLVPNARFLRSDMTELAFPPGTFDVIVSFFAIIHVPAEEQPVLFQRMAAWLVAGGYLLVTAGHRAWTGTEDDWHGAPMYWSHADAATYREWFQVSGFQILSEQFIPEGDSGHALFLARRT